MLVSCAKNLNPCLWFAEDGKRIGTYEGHNGAVWSCEITIDSDRLITASADQTVRIWDLPTGQELHQIRMNEPCRACHLAVGEQLMAFTADSFMGSPPQIHLIDMDMKEFEHQGSAPKQTVNAPKGRITRVYFTDCNRVLISSHDGGFVSALGLDASGEPGPVAGSTSSCSSSVSIKGAAPAVLHSKSSSC